MRPPVFVEILSRSKDVRHRHRIDSLPIRIGRGYDNDIILDDPHIAEHHAVIEQNADGSLTIRDQDSRNGIVFTGTRKTEIELDGNIIVKLGHTNMRVRAADFNVEMEVPVSRFHYWEGWPPALVGLALMILLVWIETWIGDASKFESASYFKNSIYMLFCGITWCGIWAFANKLFGEHTRFGRHLFILGCGIIVITLVSYITEIIAYAMSLEAFTRYGSHFWIAAFTVMVFFHLQQINPNLTRSFAIASITLSFICSGVMLLLNYSSSETLADELFMTTRFPPALRLTEDKPVAKLLDDALKLKIKLDKERAKAASEDGTDESE